MVNNYNDDEIFRDVNSFYKRMMERVLKGMEDYEKIFQSGDLKGNWEFKPINKPGLKGYVARGHFQTDDKPVTFSGRALEEKRDPLTDVFEQGDKVTIYMELPGIEKSDIQLNVTERTVDVKAKNFMKSVEMPTENVDLERATASYKNGVLTVTVPKLQNTAEDEKKRTIKIE